jgi:putative tricarboxylic transport membrane protein
MNVRSNQMKLGIGAVVAAVFLLTVAIPFWVSSPANVPNIVLAPTFWPQILAAVTGVTGVGLMVFSSRRRAVTSTSGPEAEEKGAAIFRMIGLAAIMGLALLAMPRLGLVWTAMLVFASLAFLVRTRHPGTVLICAVAVPLILYGFFAHVAGVAIPQGHFVRLP